MAISHKQLKCMEKSLPSTTLFTIAFFETRPPLADGASPPKLWHRYTDSCSTTPHPAITASAVHKIPHNNRIKAVTVCNKSITLYVWRNGNTAPCIPHLSTTLKQVFSFTAGSLYS
jgi:hypothetical protein